MKKTVGFIGCGNMGGALAIACAKQAEESDFILQVSDLSADRLHEIAAQTGAEETTSDCIARNADIIFLAVKPQVYPSVISSIVPILTARTEKPLIISIAAGISIDHVRELGISDECPIIRIMPNTPASVGEGLILYACNHGAKEWETVFCELMQKAGKLFPIAEEKIDAASALSGCGPAFVCLFAEALADGAVACGLSRTDATAFAAQTLLGTARLMQETCTHPGVLKDAVCSPGGTTIQGVRVLEERGFRAAAMDAVIAAYEKTIALKAGK